MYLQLKCLQGSELKEDYKFKDLREVCENLIDYHSMDCDMSIERGLFDRGDYLNCWKELSYFDWDLIIRQ